MLPYIIYKNRTRLRGLSLRKMTTICNVGTTAALLFGAGNHFPISESFFSFFLTLKAFFLLSKLFMLHLLSDRKP